MRWARVSDPALGLTVGLPEPSLIQLGVAVVYRPAEGAGAFGWAVNEEGDLRSACAARSETCHSAALLAIQTQNHFDIALRDTQFIRDGFARATRPRQLQNLQRIMFVDWQRLPGGIRQVIQ